MPARPQKPVDQLQYTRGGRAERRTFPLAVPDGELTVPEPPKALRGPGKAVWCAYWSDPVSCASSRVDGYDIARYCTLIDRRDKFERQVLRCPLVESIGGQTVNPIFRIIRETTREIERLRDQLGILPLARMRLGLVQTQRDLGRVDLLRRMERQTEAVEAMATDGIIDLGELG